MKTKIAIFASGSGTNAEEIIKYFKGHPKIKVSLILSNNRDAYVLERAKKHMIPHYAFSSRVLYKTQHIDEVLRLNGIKFIVLAGFMLLVPERMIKQYDGNILNIHPALLPKYGGKGMYGMHVHEAVKANKDKESGITIHWVNEKYDEGQILFQANCKISASDSAEDIANKVHQLEYEYYPGVIEEAIMKVFHPDYKVAKKV